MKQINKQKLLEESIYWVIWLIVFLFPVIGNYYYGKSSGTAGIAGWRLLYNTWLRILPFFLLFIANNYLLAPRLLLCKKYLAYSFSVLAVIAFLFLFYPAVKSHPQRHSVPPGQEQMKNEHFFPPRGAEKRLPEPPGMGAAEGRPGFRQSNELPGLPPDSFNENLPVHSEEIQLFGDQRMAPPSGNGKKRPDFQSPFKNKKPSGLPGEMTLMSFFQLITAVLLVGFNIAIKLMFKSIRDDATLAEMEHRHLQSQLEYLKYQINPHFFMNTLNNIHALVDIDTDKAKTTLVELSKLMRYVLYEANNKTVLLSKEIQFLENYIALMRLRYTDKVNIQGELPAEVPPLEIPPLLFISFVENAFKHGVSYQQKSFIRISLEIIDQRLHFCCFNTNWGKSEEQHHGIGLDNVRKRLELLFHQDYNLKIREGEDCFDVSLTIPLL